MKRLLAGAAFALVAANASAVSVLIDVDNLNGSGPGSLADAIAQAHGLPPDVIPIIKVNATGELDVASEMAIQRTMIIQGPGRYDLTIRATGTNRIFNVTPPGFPSCPALPAATGNFTFQLTDATLAGGRPSDGKPGGAVQLNASGSFDRVIFRDNAANVGGAVAMNVVFDQQQLFINRSALLENFARHSGGPAIFANGGGAVYSGPFCAFNNPPGVGATPDAIFAISNSVLRDNTVQTGGGTWGLGGGIWASGSHLQVFITDTRVVDNRIQPVDTTVSHGGGAFFDGVQSVRLLRSEWSGNEAIDGGTMAVEQNVLTGGAATLPQVNVDFINATIFDNQATGRGPAGYFFGNTNVRVFNSTIANNRHGTVGGGGLYFNTGPVLPVNGTNAPPGTLTLNSSIVWSDGTQQDVGKNDGAIPTFPVNATHSLIGVPCPSCVLSGSDNILGQDPMLARPAFNAGSI